MGNFFGKFGKLGNFLQKVYLTFDSIINGGFSNTAEFDVIFDCETAGSELTSENYLIDCSDVNNNSE